GYALLPTIRALQTRHGRALPAIALTAYAQAQDRTRAIASGFTRYIVKPVDTDLLLATLAELRVTEPPRTPSLDPPRAPERRRDVRGARSACAAARNGRTPSTEPCKIDRAVEGRTLSRGEGPSRNHPGCRRRPMPIGISAGTCAKSSRGCCGKACLTSGPSPRR